MSTKRYGCNNDLLGEIASSADSRCPGGHWRRATALSECRVEEYFHIEAAYGAIVKEQWTDWPLWVKRNVDLLLDLFARYRRRYTFFVLGDMAREPPTHSTLAALRCSLECVDEFTWRWS